MFSPPPLCILPIGLRTTLRSLRSHPSAEIAAQARCPPLSVFGCKLSLNSGDCDPPPPSTKAPSSSASPNPAAKERPWFGISHKSRCRLCMIRTNRGSRARKALGTGGTGSIARGPCCESVAVSKGAGSGWGRGEAQMKRYFWRISCCQPRLMHFDI